MIMPRYRYSCSTTTELRTGVYYSPGSCDCASFSASGISLPWAAWFSGFSIVPVPVLIEGLFCFGVSECNRLLCNGAIKTYTVQCKSASRSWCWEGACPFHREFHGLDGKHTNYCGRGCWGVAVRNQRICWTVAQITGYKRSWDFSYKCGG